MHRELEWPVSKATCLYKKLYMVYSFLYTIIEGTRLETKFVRSAWCQPSPLEQLSQSETAIDPLRI
jgi:hypothetical protein